MITITRIAVAQPIIVLGTADIGIADGIGRMEVKSSPVKEIPLTTIHKASSLPTVANSSLTKRMLKPN
jgi:hypothetical protein